MTKIISFAIQKGGVGKTTSTAALSEIMTSRGYRVLAIDLDPQHSLTKIFGALTGKNKHIGATLDDEEPDPISEIIKKDVGNGFDIAPSHSRLARVEGQIVPMRNADRLLKFAIRPVLNDYDYIFIDSLPGSGKLMENALAASTHVLIPSQPAIMDIEGLLLFLETIKGVSRSTNRKLVNGGIFLTMFSEGYNLHNEAREEIELADIPFTGICIPRAIDTAVSAGHGMSIFTYAPKSKPSLAYQKLADYIEKMETG